MIFKVNKTVWEIFKMFVNFIIIIEFTTIIYLYYLSR